MSLHLKLYFAIQHIIASKASHILLAGVTESSFWILIAGKTSGDLTHHTRHLSPVKSFITVIKFFDK